MIKLSLNSKEYRVLLLFFFIFVFLGSLPAFKLPKGIRLFTVKSGSMSPVIYSGSLIITKTEIEYRPNEVITFLNSQKGPKELLTTTHRIQQIIEKKEGLFFMTKGDTNAFSDPEFIPFSYVVGRVVASVPVIGFISDLVHSKYGFIILILLPGTIIILKEVFLIFNLLKTRKKQDLSL